METSSTTPKSYQRLRNEHALLWFADGREGIPLKAVSCSEVLLKLVQQNSTACIPDLSRTQVRMWSMQAAQSGCLTSVEELVEAIKVGFEVQQSISTWDRQLSTLPCVAISACFTLVCGVNLQYIHGAGARLPTDSGRKSFPCSA